MRDKFFELIVAVKHSEFYIRHYDIKTARHNFLFSALLVSMSILSVSISIANTGLLSFISALLTITLQFLQALNQMFPYSKRLKAFNYYKKEIAILALDMENEFLDIDLHGHEDERISSSLRHFRNRMKELDNIYLKELQLPTCTKCDSKASIDNDKYFDYYYTEESNDES